jgi:uncharacterized protein
VNAYVDSSVVLRVILSAHDSLAEWNEIDQYAASALLRVECYRAIDRIRLMGQATEVEAASRQRSLEELLRHVNLIDVSPRVLQSASGSFPVPLKTLDAIHLATAMSWREAEGEPLVFATHDRKLGLAARAAGFRVLGL